MKLEKIYAISFSVGLHMIFFGVAYILNIVNPFVPQPFGYQISLQGTQGSMMGEKIPIVDTLARTKDNTLFTKDLTAGTSSPKAICTAKTNAIQRKKVKSVRRSKAAQWRHVKKKEKKVIIDKRGLHVGSYINGKRENGAVLDLVGWIWNIVPQPQDTTEESGRIVFEIKVDAFGEVVAIKTLEKTVTPLVEQIYADALTGLTFSKTSSSHSYPSVSIGKVTFLIQAK